VVVADGGADDFVQSQRVGPLDLVSEGVEPENMAAVRELLLLFALGCSARWATSAAAWACWASGSSEPEQAAISDAVAAPTRPSHTASGRATDAVFLFMRSPLLNGTARAIVSGKSQ
jgi:hypothetical protein